MPCPRSLTIRMLKSQIQQNIKLLCWVIIPNLSDGSKGYPRACLASKRYSSIEVLSALLSLEDGKQELNKGKALMDNWGLFRIFQLISCHLMGVLGRISSGVSSSSARQLSCAQRAL
ncbi:hypothetical protein HYC85_020036 [Camellia sinensis]|uniref:Uncharacterized protein n=1 Tax=Camellia sinensis TaxID=4442 RepID=A0A7J7GSI0_CAMSI|nr:hypothetical protein HYC85_020036 [Camellia sinensis]